VTKCVLAKPVKHYFRREQETLEGGTETTGGHGVQSGTDGMAEKKSGDRPRTRP